MSAVHPAALAEQALSLAKTPCQVLITASSTANVRWAANTLTTNGLSDGHEVTVISVVNGAQVGSVTRTGVGLSDLGELVAQAEATAALASPAEDASELVPGAAEDSFDRTPGQLGADDLRPLAERLAEAFASAKSTDQELFGYAEQTLRTTYLATSTGTRAAWPEPEAQVHLNGKAAGRSRSAWAGAAASTLAEVDVWSLTAEVSQRLGWQATQLELAPGRHSVVLPPSALADLLIYAYLSADLRSAMEGRSVFSRSGGGTRIGETLSTFPLTVSSDPARPGQGCAPVVATTSSNSFTSVFDNGLPIAPVTWLTAGQLTALPGTRHSARAADLPHTQFVDNLRAEAAEARGSTMDLVAELNDGLLITCLWYIREVDPATLLLSGLTRDGVYRVRDGEVIGAVPNFRFNESPIDLLRRITAAGASVPTLAREFGDFFSRTSMPPVNVTEFNFSSVSKAS